VPSYKAFLATEAEIDLEANGNLRPAVATPKPVKSGTVPLPKLRQAEEVNVELILDPPAPIPPPVLTIHKTKRTVIFPPTRRDWLYFAGGCGLTLAAVGLGFGLAQLARRKPRPEE
jgi:hypothetical protein